MKTSSFFLIFIAALCLPVLGQTVSKKAKGPQTEKQFINPEGLVKSPAYSHAVSVSGGRTIYVSGQVALNGKGEIVGAGDLRAQTEQVFANLKTVLEASGADFSNVVKLAYYVRNYKPEDAPIIREIRGKYFPKDLPPPASTLVGVQSLFRDDVLIEIEAIAVVENNR